MKLIGIIIIFLFTFELKAQTEPDWAEGAIVPEAGRSNPYQDPQVEYQKAIRAGLIHTLHYPVTVTGLLIPERPIKEMFEKQTLNPFRKLLISMFKNFMQLNEFNDLFRWIGLHEYPEHESDLKVPYPGNVKPQYLMGYTRFDMNGTQAFTMSCTGCHAANLFGDKIIGMTNRFPRGNQFFVKGEKMSKLYNPHWFRILSGATKAETKIADRSVRNLASVGVKIPQQLGLDTALAQVALSLAKRTPNPWADKNEYYEQNPRRDLLDQIPGDSKPAVWWNLKFKNRWLSDGSVVSGNPIYTNILWNEIGRGTDLHDLDQWLKENEKVIKELTTAVFATEAPRIEKYFSEDKIHRENSQHGEQLFNQMCSKCHGTYVKAWSLPNAESLPWKEQIQTIRVVYPETTKVIDVGTDPNRYRTMKSLEKLNSLEISQKNGIKIVTQKGYVPPPLVGIWARWPYLHNNSIPSLCELLTPSAKRSPVYYAGEAVDRNRDFDFECNGYPSGAKVPSAWKRAEFAYDTSREALSNRGHDDRIFIKDGQEILSLADKKNLIQFLQTL